MIKKTLGSLFAASLLALPALAQQVTVIINGSPAQFDQPPVMQGGRVLVPMRGIFERMGASVVYIPQGQQIRATSGQTMVELQIGSREARINGRPTQLDVPAQTVGGRTVVPLRFISESLGAQVRWDNPSSTVSISFQAPPSEEYHPPQPPPPHHPVAVPPPPRPHHIGLREIAPQNRQGVPANFNWELTTERGARVEFSIIVYTPAPPGVHLPPQIRRGEAHADGNGNVIIPVQVDSPPGVRVDLRATAIGPRGERSHEARLSVTRM